MFRLRTLSFFLPLHRIWVLLWFLLHFFVLGPLPTRSPPNVLLELQPPNNLLMSLLKRLLRSPHSFLLQQMQIVLSQLHLSHPRPLHLVTMSLHVSLVTGPLIATYIRQHYQRKRSDDWPVPEGPNVPSPNSTLGFLFRWYFISCIPRGSCKCAHSSWAVVISRRGWHLAMVEAFRAFFQTH